MLFVSSIFILHFRKFAQFCHDIPDGRAGLVMHLQPKWPGTRFARANRMNGANDRFKVLGKDTDEPILTRRQVQPVGVEFDRGQSMNRGHDRANLFRCLVEFDFLQKLDGIDFATLAPDIGIMLVSEERRDEII